MTPKFETTSLRLLESLFTINERPCSEAIEMIAQRTQSDFATVSNWFQEKRNKQNNSINLNNNNNNNKKSHHHYHHQQQQQQVNNIKKDTTITSATTSQSQLQQQPQQNRATSLLRNNNSQMMIKSKRNKEKKQQQLSHNIISSSSNINQNIINNNNCSNNGNRLITNTSSSISNGKSSKNINNIINYITKNNITNNNNNNNNNKSHHRTSTESSSADSSSIASPSATSNLIFPFDASQLLEHLQQQLFQQQLLQQHQQQQLQQQQQLHPQPFEQNRNSIYDDEHDDEALEEDLQQQDLPLNDIDYYASSNSAAPSAVDCEDYDDLDIHDYTYEEIAAVSEIVRQRRMNMGLSQTKASQSFRAFTGGQIEFADNFIAQFEIMQADQKIAKWALRSFEPWLEYIEGELSMGRELLFMAHDDPTRTARRREGRVFTFSEYQRTILENCFAESQYLTPEQFDELSRTIRVPNRSLKTWFKNRRSKQRSQLKASERRKAQRPT